MNNSLPLISLIDLGLVLIPTALVLAVMQRWCGEGLHGAYATARMLAQLLLVGYVLTWLFETDAPGVVLAVLILMILAAAWIALRPMRTRTARHYALTALALTLGGGVVLVLVTQVVIDLTVWFAPRFVIPLAGMIFANTMNTISLAGERLQSELAAGASARAARERAFNAAMIPQVNTFLAVGIVALPGMMTGQILSGTDPLIAARYQIVVMSMIFASGGLAGACYLWLMTRAARAI